MHACVLCVYVFLRVCVTLCVCVCVCVCVCECIRSCVRACLRVSDIVCARAPGAHAPVYVYLLYSISSFQVGGNFEQRLPVLAPHGVYLPYVTVYFTIRSLPSWPREAEAAQCGPRPLMERRPTFFPSASCVWRPELVMDAFSDSSHA